MAVESRAFAASARLPDVNDALAWLGLDWPASPLNLSLLLALLAALLVYLLLWRPAPATACAAVGASPAAAAYAGIRSQRQVMRGDGDLGRAGGAGRDE